MSDGTLTLDLRKSFRWGGGHWRSDSWSEHQWGPDNVDGRGEDGQVIGEVGRGRLLYLAPPQLVDRLSWDRSISWFKSEKALYACRCLLVLTDCFELNLMINVLLDTSITFPRTRGAVYPSRLFWGEFFVLRNYYLFAELRRSPHRREHAPRGDINGI